MTPEREAYLAKCSKREKYLRKEIKDYKREIKTIKSALQTESDYGWYLGCLRFRKLWLTMCRHELARLKGMDRVAMPYKVYDKSTDLEDWYCSNCDREVLVFEGYCPNCGRRILWEKG